MHKNTKAINQKNYEITKNSVQNFRSNNYTRSHNCVSFIAHCSGILIRSFFTYWLYRERRRIASFQLCYCFVKIHRYAIKISVSYSTFEKYNAKYLRVLHNSGFCKCITLAQCNVKDLERKSTLLFCAPRYNFVVNIWNITFCNVLLKYFFLQNKTYL